MTQQKVWAIRLQQYALNLRHILSMVDIIQERDASSMTESRELESYRESLHDGHKIIEGYCLALDDFYGLSHGTMLHRWHKVFDQENEPNDLNEREARYEAILHGSEED